MKVKRKSIITGKWNEMDLPITKQQLNMYENNEVRAADIFPNLTADHLEFLNTGIIREDSVVKKY